MARRTLLAAAIVACLARYCHCCIYLFGDAKDSLAVKSVPHWNHGFFGDDWDDAAWSCKTGTRQSPINIASADPDDSAWNGANADVGSLPSNLKTSWNYPALVSNGSNVQVINNGHTIQVQWYYNYASDVTIAAPAHPQSTTSVTSVLDMSSWDASTRVPIKPLQFHFHTYSEHMVHGMLYPLEMHIVHQVQDPKLPACVAQPCFSVTAVFFEIDPTGQDNPLLNAIWNNMPMREGETVYLPSGASINLNSLLPSSTSREYVTYSGSLTTPPCSEGLLWHVFTKPQKISLAQWRKYLTAVGLKECEEVADRRRNRRLLGATEAEPVSTSGGRSVYDPVTRRVMAENGTYTCSVAAYGWNYRLTQPINHRKVKVAGSGGISIGITIG